MIRFDQSCSDVSVGAEGPLDVLSMQPVHFCRTAVVPCALRALRGIDQFISLAQARALALKEPHPDAVIR